MAFAAFIADSFSWAGFLAGFSVLLMINLMFADISERARSEEERAASRPPR